MAGGNRPGFRNIVRGLRFRLALSYLVFFALLVCGLGLLFREILSNTLYEQALNTLDAEWGEMKGYLKIENARPQWQFDRFDPEESFIVTRIQRVYISLDKNGNILERSSNYADGTLTPPSVDHVRQVLKNGGPYVHTIRGSDGIEYLVRDGVMPEERRAGSPEPHRDYFVSIGRPLNDNTRAVNGFTWRYFAFVPLLILLAGVIGWMVAGRALQPVATLAGVARRITGSNLNVQIPTRGARDELDDLIDAFNRMTERLRQSFEQIRQFSTDVSHELRTPLTGIRGQLEVALFTATTPDQYREAMMNALQDVERLSDMVRALLRLSQAESGQIALQLAPVDLTQVLEDVVEQYQVPAEDEGVALTCLGAEPCIVRGDRTQLHRLASNLISNAIKYTPRGGSVTTGVRRAGHDAELYVQDTGVGIPPENIPHIFDRFYRVRNPSTSTKQGLGLGLSFVAWIVNAHGGRIDVTSEPGKGARFTVRIPLAPGSEPPAVSASATHTQPA